jgi:O-antigen ligase
MIGRLLALLQSPRGRHLLVGMFLIGASLAAGWSIYHGKLKILAILGLITLGVFLRQASFANAYLLTMLTSTLSMVRIGPIHDEFDQDKWLALILMTVIALGAALFSIRRPVLPKPVHLVVLVLVAVSAYSVSYSFKPGLSFQKAGVFAMVLAIAYVGIWSVTRTAGDVMRFLEVHVDSLWLVWPVCTVSLVLGGDLFLAGRFRSIFLNPNNLGFWASSSVPLLVVLATSHPNRTRRIVCGAMACVGFLSAILAGSRGGIIGSVLGCLVYVGLRFPRRTLASLAVAGVFLAFVFAYGAKVVIPDSLMQIIRPDTIGDLSDRRLWWTIGVLIWHQRPWLGHGFGLTDLLFTHYGLEEVNPGAFGATVHNSYLEAGMNIGWIGLIAVVTIQVWSAWAAFRTWKADPNGIIGRMSLALLCVIVAVSAHSAIESTLFAPGNPWCLPFWVTTALTHRLAAIQAAGRRGTAAATGATAAPATT